LAEDGVQEHRLGTTRSRARAARARGFTIVDILSSIAVIMVLIALMLPSLSTIRESARRVVCGSNVRQIGLGLAMYADDYERFLPPSRFAASSQEAIHQSTLVRAAVPAVATGQSYWDGVGILYEFDYLAAPGVFYCPSHHGDHPFSRYVSRWPNHGTEIVSNYQFRVGESSFLDGSNSNEALVADALRTRADFNHSVGCNFLRRDLSATWYTDSMGEIIAGLPANEAEAQAADRVARAWQILDGIDANGDRR
jgi:type II secretory pathway pseudopilin PulG